jgi:UDP-4-amino-4,6-dideoxy-N-acetyl-beta-L-altrosamine transaminase
MAEALALHGGTPVRATLLPYAKHSVDDEDIQAVAAALRSGWLTTGPAVDAFEQAVASVVAAKHAVAVNSGTAALHCAVFAAGVGAGDEVITSPLTFVASANAVLYQRGVPIFADIRSDTLMLDPDEVAARVTSRSRAILPVDFAGQPCDLDALLTIAREHNLMTIEDAAHALGASHRGRPIGSVADLTVFSFHPAKLISTAEGGMVATDDDGLASRLRRFRNHGLDTDFRERAARGATYSSMVELGYNYRLADVQCALGLSQLGRLEQFLKRRSAIAERYAGALASVPQVTMPAVGPHVRHAWHIFPVLLRLEQLRADRTTILAALHAENIGATVHYVPAYWHPYYAALGYRRGLCPRAEDAYERILTLPLFPAMTDSDVEDVVAALRKVLAHYTR